MGTMHVLSEWASSGWATVEATMAVAHNVAMKTLLVCGYGIVVCIILGKIGKIYIWGVAALKYHALFFNFPIHTWPF